MPGGVDESQVVAVKEMKKQLLQLQDVVRKSRIKTVSACSPCGAWRISKTVNSKIIKLVKVYNGGGNVDRDVL